VGLPNILIPEIDVRGKSPYLELVPKGRVENLKFREKLYREGRTSRTSAEQIWSMCSKDILFWIQSFLCLFEPRPRAKLSGGSETGMDDVKELPFITWPFQDKAMLILNDCVEKGNDVVLAKTRDVGATWVFLAVFLWRWQFRDMNSFLVVSRKEEYVDKTGDPKTLFWKLDYMLKRQPIWLKPSMGRSLLSLRNLDNGSTIDGESTNGDVARGDRRTAIGLDEFAAVENGRAVLSATRDATSCRVFVSTPGDADCAFNEVVKKRPYVKLYLHWTLHPDKARGLYYQDGKPRSPWYDKEVVDRGHNAVEVARELDLDFEGSSYRFFPVELTEKLAMQTVRKPAQRGTVATNDKGEFLGFEKSDTGELELWVALDEKGRVPQGRRYAIGADISQGTGASVSCMKVADIQTGEVVAEWSSPRVDPLDLGEIGAALGWMFNEAYFCWEANGPGRSFGRKIMECGYRNIYWKRTTEKKEEFMDKGFSGIAGWYNEKDLKAVLMREYRRALSTMKFVERGLASVEELENFVVEADGSIMHVGSKTKEDPTGARENHGDRATAGMLACFAIAEQSKGKARPGEGVEAEPEEIPVGCLAWRINERRKDRSRGMGWG
jgi:terminase large subunit-like protein